MKSIYLDYAAATPLDTSVLAAMQPYFSEHFFNASSPYLSAQKVRRDIEAARKRVAHWLGARPVEIIFTAGGTEANNLAIHGVMEAFPGKRVVISSIEHESVIEPAQHYEAVALPVDGAGNVNADSLEQAIDDDTVLVSLIMANNEIGTVQNLRELSQVIARVRAKRQTDKHTLPLYLHTDACQAATQLDLHANRLGIDLMTLNAGKIYGPKQVGCLYVKTGVVLSAQTLGGGQEFGVRSGTENTAGIMGFAAALDRVQTKRTTEAARLQKLRSDFVNTISQALPESFINGAPKNLLPSIISITIPGVDGERLVMELDERGIQVATGSACAAASDGPSHVLQAIGLTPAEAAATLRVSIGEHTTAADLKKAAAIIGDVVAQLLKQS